MNRSIRTYAPLIILTIIIIGIAFIRPLFSGSWDTFSFMHDFMGAFFLIFGGFKIIKLHDFVTAYQEYDLLAQRSTAYAYAYPFIEVGLGIVYFLRLYLIPAYWVTLILMLVSAVGVYKALRTKGHIPCACLGTVFNIPMTYVTLGEDLLMAFMAAYMLLRS